MRLYITTLSFLISSCVLSQDFNFLNVYVEDQIVEYAVDGLEFDNQLSSIFSHDVRMYKALYEMPFLDDVIQVSGAVFVPVSGDYEDEYPIVVFNHGTTFVRTSTPSFNEDISNLGYFLSSLGFVVLMPDYVGLGESQIMHPYCHAQSESDCGWSFVRAVVESSDELDINLNGKLFISGYSQGGHVAMAMAMNDPPVSIQDDIELTAVAPLSGPYDLSGIQLPMTFQEISYSNPAYLFYILKGWNSVYGNIYSSFSEVCNEPYASIIESMLDGTHSADEINAVCPEELTDLFSEDLIQEVIDSEDHIIMQLAEENDVYQWVPEIPVHMRYCTQDEEVFYQNALSAESWMNENGATDVIAYNVGDVNHNDCALSAITNSMLWFYSLNNNGTSIIHEYSLNNNSVCTVYDLYGRVIYQGSVDLIPSLYGLYIIDYGTEVHKLFVNR